MAGRHMDDTVAQLPVSAEPDSRNGHSTADVDLSVDPFDDDLADELKARQPIRLTSRTTLALGGVVLIVGGFLGGVLVKKNFGTSTATNQAGSTANARGGFGGANGGFGGAAGNGQAGTGQTGTGQTGTRNATTGTVKLVDGTTVYLTTADGSIVTVKTSGTTTVRIEQAATLKDLATGATVTVQGTANADGIITATQVTSQK